MQEMYYNKSFLKYFLQHNKLLKDEDKAKNVAQEKM
jgi:hypothetical protein